MSFVRTLPLPEILWSFFLTQFVHYVLQPWDPTLGRACRVSTCPRGGNSLVVTLEKSQRGRSSFFCVFYQKNGCSFSIKPHHFSLYFCLSILFAALGITFSYLVYFLSITICLLHSITRISHCNHV